LLDHFGNAPIRTGDPENLGVYTIFSILSYKLNELGPKKWNFGTGDPKLHIIERILLAK